MYKFKFKFRVHLYKYIKEVQEAGGKLVYCDTDSLVFKYKKTNEYPIKLGSSLGEMEDQYPDKEILEFVAASPKSYTIRMRDKKTGEEEYVLKSKGLYCFN